MIKNILYYLIVFIFISPINCSEENEQSPLLEENTPTTRRYSTVQGNQPLLTEIESDDSQTDSEEGEYAPTDDSENDLFAYMGRTAFETEGSALVKLSRWGGRGLGFVAENAMTPMILYVILDLINFSKDHEPYNMGAIDIVITASMLLYLFLPAVENMAQAGQDFYEFCYGFCDPTPPIPEQYRAINPYSPLPLSLSMGSKFHAASMALILTTVFHHIENSKVASYDWFFWTCFAPYALAVFNKNQSYFDHGRKMQKIHQRFENKTDRNVRKILEASYNKCEEELPNLPLKKLQKIYLFLKDANNSPSRKDRKLHSIARSNSPPAAVNREGIQMEDASLSRHTGTTYFSSQDIRDELSRQTSNLIFYGSTLSEYFFYEFGLRLLCERLNISSTLATDILSYGGATILSTISFIFEDTSITEYYETIFKQCFGSSHSVSNLKFRKGLGVKSFVMGGLLALSEVYPAWKATLSSGPAAWPFLVFMVARRHAPNALWLQQGYDRTISDWHSRDCGRDNCCCTGCKRGKNNQEMISYISDTLKRLKVFRDHLNAQGIRINSKNHFDRASQNNTTNIF